MIYTHISKGCGCQEEPEELLMMQMTSLGRKPGGLLYNPGSQKGGVRRASTCLGCRSGGLRALKGSNTHSRAARTSTGQQLTSAGCRRGNITDSTTDQILTELQMQMRLLEGTAKAQGMRISAALAEGTGVLLQFSRATGPGRATAGKWS